MGKPGLPDCPEPEHAGGRVTKAGFYGKAPHRRQRFWCDPPNGDDRHRFAPLLPRWETHEGRCQDCEREVPANEGPQAVRLYRHNARDVAAALLLVAGGASYREASEQARQHAGRGGGVVHGQLVADWVETFALPLWDRFGTDQWPEVIVCDEKKVTRRSTFSSGLSGYPTRRSAQKKMKRVDSYTLLVAAARFRNGWPAVMAYAVPRAANQTHWEEFFRLLGGRPRAVVADHSPKIFNAAAAVWPLDRATGEAPPQPVWCLHHVKENFPWPGWAKQPTTLAEVEAEATLRRAFNLCTTSQAAWLSFVATARELMPGAPLESFLSYNGRHIQITTQLRTMHPGDPQSNSAAEAAIRWIHPRLSDRPFTNQQRTNRLLRLMVLAHQGQTDPRDWSHAIRAYAGHHQGRPTSNQREISDPAGRRSLG